MTEANHFARINAHYARADLADDILGGLRRAGKDPEHLAYDDLSPVDQFHTLGKQATDDLATLARLAPGMRVLDLGGGLGGPARTLASEYGCQVTVLDITEEYCRIGALLTQRAGLGKHVLFRHGDALDIPFDDGQFDVVWTQHCTMNIEDKDRLCSEMRRVLRPDGRAALHEIMAGPNQPIHFPVPWASVPELSFLQPPERVRSHIERNGFEILELRDGSAAATEWFRARLSAPPAPPPPLGLHLLVGPASRTVFENVLRNFEEGRTVVIQAVCRTL